MPALPHGPWFRSLQMGCVGILQARPLPAGSAGGAGTPGWGWHEGLCQPVLLLLLWGWWSPKCPCRSCLPPVTHPKGVK